MTEYVKNTYDDLLMKLLVENKTLINFLFSIFGFLGRKTDFYIIRDELINNSENVGFPPGVAEELVVKILRECDPFQTTHSDGTDFKICSNSEYVPNMVAEEVEVETTDFDSHSKKENGGRSCEKENNRATTSCQSTDVNSVETLQNLTIECGQSNEFDKSNLNIDQREIPKTWLENYEPKPLRNEEIDKFNTAHSQKDSETYNGANRDAYRWSQKIGELDVTIPLPPCAKSAKCVKVNITPNVFSVDYNMEGCWHSLIKDNLYHRIKSGETIWSMSEGNLRIHLEKQDERWWTSLLESEPEIDTTRIDCSRPLDELPEDHIAKVRELQWKQMNKIGGKQTSEEIQKLKALKKSWNLEGSPFMNTPFDPSVLH